MEKNSKIKGSHGEEHAILYLKKKSYVILEKNWRYKQYEIDIIAQNQNTIVFVEVKSRANDAFGEPELAVTRKKQKFLVLAANHYLQTHTIELECRFDIIAILSINNNITVKHLEDAFYPSVK
ncbi:MAG: YraN family protein [Bacteroidetes bacterium]|nr:YraN family protein [Bacteroidota bacterium]